jgi:hypothetical protein
LQDVPELSATSTNRQPPQLLLLGHASKLTRLTELSSLSIIQQRINRQDWEAIVTFGSQLTVRARSVRGQVALFCVSHLLACMQMKMLSGHRVASCPRTVQLDSAICTCLLVAGCHDVMCKGVC